MSPLRSRSSRRLVLSALLLAPLCALPHSSAQAPERLGPPIVFQVTDLGPATGGPVSLNDLGSVVVGPASAEGDSYSLLWKKGTASRIPARGFVAADISDKDAIVGWAPLGRDSEGNRVLHAAQYLGGNRLKDLTPEDGIETRAVAVNRAGSVAITGLQAQFHADGQTSEVGKSDPGAEPFLPVDLNAAGTLAGNQGPEPFLWRDGEFIPLERGDRHEQAIVKGISDSGFVCGYGTQADGKNADALKWKAGELTRLDGYGANFGTVALSVNDRGNVVGFAFKQGAYPNLWAAHRPSGPVRVASAGPRLAFGAAATPRMDQGVAAQRACLWLGAKNYDLNLMLRKDAGQGWRLRAAYEINNKNQIVGEGLLRGKPHYFLLTPTR